MSAAKRQMELPLASHLAAPWLNFPVHRFAITRIATVLAVVSRVYANRPELVERVKATGGRISETLTRKTHTVVVDPRAIIDGIWTPTTRKGELAMSRMVSIVVMTPAWVSNAIEQEIEVNKRRPKVTDIGVVKLPVVVHGSMSEVELPPRKQKRTK
jgi:hypothetical protein